MKINVLITTAILSLLTAMTLSAQEKNRKDLTSVRFETSIDCEGCVNTIMKNIPFEKGIRDVKCDLTTKEVTVQYQTDKTSAETIRKSIEKLGYTAKEVTNKNKEEAARKGSIQ